MGEVHALPVRRPRWVAKATQGMRQVCTFPVLLGALLVGGVFFGARIQGVQGGQLFGEGDTWWHLRAGEDILARHALPLVDTYSATARGTGWIAYEWLGEVAMAEAYRAGGLVGLKWLNFGLTSCGLLLLYAYAAERSGNAKAAFIVCAVCLPVYLGFCTMRPQLLGWIFFLLTLACIEGFARGNGRCAWILPLIFFLWVNTHGTFILGLLALLFTGAGSYFQFERAGIFSERWDPARRRTFSLAVLGCFSVLPLTPYGARLAAYPLELLLQQPVNVANIQEWLPLTTERLFAVAVLVLIVGFFLSLIFGGARFRISECALLLVLVFGAATHLRFVILLVFAAVPLVAAGLGRVVPPYNRERDHPEWNAALILFLLVLSWHALPTITDLENVMSRSQPVGAAAYLRMHPARGMVFNEYGWGGYLIWTRTLPEGVFIDGRADLYERTGTLGDYLRLARLEPGAFDVIRKYDVQTFLLRRDSALATVLDASPDWQRQYRDDLAVVFSHRSASQEAAHDERSPD